MQVSQRINITGNNRMSEIVQSKPETIQIARFGAGEEEEIKEASPVDSNGKQVKHRQSLAIKPQQSLGNP